MSKPKELSFNLEGSNAFYSASYIINDRVIATFKKSGTVLILPERQKVEETSPAITYTKFRNMLYSVHEDGIVRRITLEPSLIVKKSCQGLKDAQGIFCNADSVIVSSFKKIYRLDSENLSETAQVINIDMREHSIIAVNQISKLISDDKMLIVNTHAGNHLWQLWNLDTETAECYAVAENESQILTGVCASNTHCAGIIGDSVYCWKFENTEGEVKPISKFVIRSQPSAIFLDSSYLVIGDINGGISVVDWIAKSSTIVSDDLTKLFSTKSRVREIYRFGRYLCVFRNDGSLKIFDLFLQQNSDVFETPAIENATAFNFFHNTVVFLKEKPKKNKGELIVTEQKWPEPFRNSLMNEECWDKTQLEILKDELYSLIEIVPRKTIAFKALANIYKIIRKVNETNTLFGVPGNLICNTFAIMDQLRFAIQNKSRDLSATLLAKFCREFRLLVTIISPEIDNHLKNLNRPRKRVNMSEKKSRLRNQSFDIRDPKVAEKFRHYSFDKARTSESEDSDFSFSTSTKKSASTPRPRKNSTLQPEPLDSSSSSSVNLSESKKKHKHKHSTEKNAEELATIE